MKAKQRSVQYLGDLVTDLPTDARIFLFMEDLKNGCRMELLTGDEPAETKQSVLKTFANAIVGSVVNAGQSLRIIYLDQQKTKAYEDRLSQIDSGIQTTFWAQNKGGN